MTDILEPDTTTPAPQRTISKTVAGKTITVTPEQAEAFGRELDALKESVIADLGERDATYIRRMIKAQRTLEIGGRALLFGGIIPPFWLAGTAMLGLSKIIDNMEIGHNVMHGQYDWTNDPALSSQAFEWDTACPADQWRHSHNYLHHTYTNIVDMDRDIGYGILRMSEDQEWRPYYLGNPLYATALATFFQYGVAMHDAFTGGASVFMAYDWVYPPRDSGESLIHVDWGNDYKLTKPYHLFKQWADPLKPGMRVAIDERALGIRASGVVHTVAGTPGTRGADGFHFHLEVRVDETPVRLEGFSVRLTIASGVDL